MTFIVGQNVGPYRIVAQLGQGGMATVYRAYHAALDRYVALKVLHPAFKEDPNFLARFQREARVVAKLEHPNIVPVYDFSEHEGQPYLVMKFIEGETLKARLARGPLSVEDGLHLLEAVGGALTYAHKQGILHRDIKPSNIMLAGDGAPGVYLADFGLARMAAAGQSTLSVDMMMGTPHYISPEQARGDKDLDVGTDIYSLGVVVYELVVGRVPFSADTPYSIIHDHIFSPLPLPSVVNPSVPEAMERVLLKALAKDRADRYPDVAAFVEAFRQAAAEAAGGVAPAQTPTPSAAARTPVLTAMGSTARAAPAAQATRVVPGARKFPWLWVGLGALVVAALVIGGIVAAGLVGNAAGSAATEQAQSTAAAQATMAAQVKPTAPPEPRPTDEPRATPTAEAPKADPYAIIAEANRAFKNKDSEKGLALLDEAVAHDPQNTKLLLAAGDAALTYSLPFPALVRYYLPATDLELAHEDDWFKPIREHTSLAMYVMAADDRALETLLKWTETYAYEEVAQGALARWYVFHDEPDAARETIDAMLEGNEQQWSLYLIRGDYFFKIGERLEAAKDYAIVVEKGGVSLAFWVRAEARCNIAKLRQAPLRATLEPTCEPRSSLVTGK